MTGEYDAQVRRQLAQAQAEIAQLRAGLRLAEGLLAKAQDERKTYRAAWHSAKDRARKQAVRADAAEVERAEAAQLSHRYRNATERAEARIAAAHLVVDRFDEYLLRRDAVADLRDALNGAGVYDGALL